MATWASSSHQRVMQRLLQHPLYAHRIQVHSIHCLLALALKKAAKDVWRGSMLTSELSQATEKALIVQVVDTVDATYLAALCNANMSRYGNSIEDLMKHLFQTYGKITPQQVKSWEMEIYNLLFDFSLPVDSIFNAIEDLLELADHANNPMSTDQAINLTYMIFALQPILMQDLRAWNKHPIAKKTWPNFKKATLRGPG